VKIPKHFRDEELPLDIQDIRTLLLKCHTKRLKAYLLLLASSGLRALEATSLRLSDVDLTTSPAQITVRKEYSKTRRSRMVYCTDEAAEYIKQLLEWTYRKGSNSKKNSNNLIFLNKRQASGPNVNLL
jgi:integrase